MFRSLIDWWKQVRRDHSRRREVAANRARHPQLEERADDYDEDPVLIAQLMLIHDHNRAVLEHGALPDDSRWPRLRDYLTLEEQEIKPPLLTRLRVFGWLEDFGRMLQGGGFPPADPPSWSG